MIRTQVSLTEVQMRALRRRSQRTGKSIARLVREGVDKVLADDDWEQRKRRLRAISGKYRSGLPDLAENHDEYYVQAVEERIGRRPRPE